MAVASAAAVDLGRAGPTYPIAEPSMLDDIQAILKEKQASGELARLQAGMVDRAKKMIETPAPVAGLARAGVRRQFHHDPSIRVDEALVDQNGRIVVPAGTVVNPLDYATFNQVYVFFDQRDEAQVKHVAQLLKTEIRQVKLVLTGGNPIKLMEAWDRRVFFDQQGLLTKRFGIKAVPAIVRRDGALLSIEEVPPL